MNQPTQSNEIAAAERAFDFMEHADIRTGLDATIDKCGNFVCFLFVIGMAVSVFEVISRYVFDAPTLWAHETTIMLVALSFAYGGTYCLARNSHISIKMLYDVVSPKAQRYLDIFNAVLGFIYTAGIAYAAFEMTRKSMWTPQGDFRLETSGSAWNQPIPPIVKGSLLFCSVLMAVQHVLYIWKAIKQSPIVPGKPDANKESS